MSDRVLDGAMAVTARSTGLAEELALRERLRRRMLEEEAIRNQQEWAALLGGEHQAMTDPRDPA